MAKRYVTLECISEPGKWFVFDRQKQVSVTDEASRSTTNKKCKKLNEQEASYPGGYNMGMK